MRRLNWHDMTVWTRRLLRQIVQLILTKSGTFTFKWLFLGCIEADPSDRRLSLTCLSCSTWVSRWDSRLYNLTKRMKLRTLESWCIWASTRPLVRRFVRWAWQKLHFDTECQKKFWENNTTWRRDWRLLAKILHVSARNEAKATKTFAKLWHYFNWYWPRMLGTGASGCVRNVATRRRLCKEAKELSINSHQPVTD